jgi:hypothetical protein
MNRNEIDFTERMQTGRDLAMIASNKGQSTGKRAGCSYPIRSGDFYGEEGSWEFLCSQARREWRRSCRQAQNDFAAACQNGPGWQADLDSLGEC